ncbi:MAG: hypothetical protein GDA67_02115 [Nitrospira sp. CR1.3]|nr:hypothetical protein [Nitrospira sp. CR1.3]
MCRQRRWAVWMLSLLVLAGCATPSFDMSDGSIEPVGPDGGIVIGSVLVQADQESPDSWYNQWFGRKAAGFTYDFEIVRAQTIDPDKAGRYADRYELDAKPKEERIFVARVAAGNYLIRTFRHEGMSAMGGQLDVRFSVAPGKTHYIGRLILDVPRRVTLGSPYTYKVEDARETTLAVVQKRQPGLAQNVVNAPMQGR